MIRKPSTTTAIKLASLVVHAEELLEELKKFPWTGTADLEGPAKFDLAAIRGIVSDPEILRWIDSLPSALLPVKR